MKSYPEGQCLPESLPSVVPDLERGVVPLAGINFICSKLRDSKG